MNHHVNWAYRPWTEEEEALVRAGFKRHSEAAGFTLKDKEPVCIVLHNDDDEMAATLKGEISFNWLYVDILYVDDAYRDKNYGTELMMAAEKLAKAKNLAGIHLHTLSWQAKPFYEKLGFELFGVLPDIVPGENRFYFLKRTS